MTATTHLQSIEALQTEASQESATPKMGEGWRELRAHQQPEWPDRRELGVATAALRALPPLVLASECDTLREHLEQAAYGESFVLMGGDCAETFGGVTTDNIHDRVKTVLQMAAVLTYGAGAPVVKIGRMAGQFGKPRSSATETRGDMSLPAYRGDIVNSIEFTPEARQPDPTRLVSAYHASAVTLNFVRAFAHAGFADARAVHAWNRGFAANHASAPYEQLTRRMEKALRYMSACGADFETLASTDIFAGHEALVLDYEDALTREEPHRSRKYDTSGHFLWVGERTRQINGAHIDFISHISNPVGVKIGPSTSSDDLLELIAKINPERIPGRLTLITRLGAHRIQDVLPPLVRAVQQSRHPVVWVCDPMHGNTVTSKDGLKTRHFEVIVQEVQKFFEIHRAFGTVPAGIHVELTGSDVTECVGGSIGVTEESLAERYHTACDPRLNHQQSLELAFLIADLIDRG
jgi:3-deoxy-7-phosphoheptulonate synthase